MGTRLHYCAAKSIPNGSGWNCSGRKGNKQNINLRATHIKVKQPSVLLIFAVWKRKLPHHTDSEDVRLFSWGFEPLLASFLSWCSKIPRGLHTHTHNSCTWSSSPAQFSSTDICNDSKSIEGCKCPIKIHCTWAEQGHVWLQKIKKTKNTAV